MLLAQAGPPEGVSLIDTLARTPLSKVFLFVLVCTVIRLVIAPKIFNTAPHQRTGGFKGLKFLNETLDAIVYAGVVVFMVIRPFGIQAFQIPSESMVDTLLVNDFIVANKAVYRYTQPKAGDIVVFRPPIYACQANQIDSDGQPKVDFIKRCIGTPGQTIEIRGGVLYRDGVEVKEAYRKGQNTSDWKLVHYEGAFQKWKGRYIPVSLNGNGQPNFNVGVSKEFSIGAAENPHDAGFPYPQGWKYLQDLTEDEIALMKELEEAPPAKIPPGHFLMMGDNREFSFDGRAWGLVPEEDIVGRAEFIWLPINRWRATR